MERVEKFDDVKKKKYVKLLREGGRRMASARACGVDPRTVEKHLHKYPEFAEEVSRAEIEANQVIENALFKSARGGNVTAMQVWLYNRASDYWKDQRNLKLSGLEDVLSRLPPELGHAVRRAIESAVPPGGGTLPPDGGRNGTATH